MTKHTIDIRFAREPKRHCLLPRRFHPLVEVGSLPREIGLMSLLLLCVVPLNSWTMADRPGRRIRIDDTAILGDEQRLADEVFAESAIPSGNEIVTPVPGRQAGDMDRRISEGLKLGVPDFDEIETDDSSTIHA